MSTATPNGEYPTPNFFTALSTAEEIQVKELNSKDATRRSFLVDVRGDAAAPAPNPNASIPKQRPDRNYVLQSAARLIENSDYLLARNLYSYLLKNNLRDQDALYGLGISFFRLGDAAASKRCFRAGWELFQSSESLYWLGVAEVQLKNDAEAIEAFSRISNPSALEASMRFDFHREYGNCLTRRGDLATAEKHYQCALELRPHSDTIMVNLGTLELQRENHDKAESHFQDALTLNPNSSKAHCGLGILELMKRHSELAEKRFLVALDLDSQNQAALLELVSIAHQKNSFIQIKPRLARYLLREPGNNNIRYQLAVCLYRESHWGACEREVDLILLNDSKHDGAVKLKQTILSQKHSQGACV